MAEDFASKAREAYMNDDFELAVDLYSRAVLVNPHNADYFADRAQAQIKLQNYHEALKDANEAIELNPKMAKGYLRKGAVYMKLGEYQTAKIVLREGASLPGDDSGLFKMIKECEKHIADLRRNYAAIESQVSSFTNRTTQGNEELQDTSGMEVDKPKYRHAFYQKVDHVALEIFAKGISETSVTVAYGEQLLSVTIDVPGENAYFLQTRLFGKIVPYKCMYRVLSTKVEIILAKAEPYYWTTLEYSKEQKLSNKVHGLSDAAAGSGWPVYPSSKRRNVDWDKLQAQEKKEEKEEKLDRDAAVNKLFGVNKNADEDVEGNG